MQTVRVTRRANVLQRPHQDRGFMRTFSNADGEIKLARIIRGPMHDDPGDAVSGAIRAQSSTFYKDQEG